jgi:hypothetical protein
MRIVSSFNRLEPIVFLHRSQIRHQTTVIQTPARHSDYHTWAQYASAQNRGTRLKNRLSTLHPPCGLRCAQKTLRSDWMRAQFARENSAQKPTAARKSLRSYSQRKVFSMVQLRSLATTRPFDFKTRAATRLRHWTKHGPVVIKNVDELHRALVTNKWMSGIRTAC